MSHDDITGGTDIVGMVLEDDGDTFWEDLPGSPEVQICMVSPNLHHWSLCPPGRAVPCPCGYNGAITCV